MPDGVAEAAPDVTPEEASLLRRVRLSLTLWSGGITLAVLVVLGIVLYLAVERSLAASGTAQLTASADAATGGRPDPDELPASGYIFGGPGSGTFRLVATGDGRPLLLPGANPRIPDGLPLLAGIQAVQADMAAPDAGSGAGGNGGAGVDGGTVTVDSEPGGPGDPESGGARVAVRAVPIRDVRTSSLELDQPDGSTSVTPIRVLTQPVVVRGQTVYLQVVGDRSTEVRTLAVLVIVLVIGGVIALVVASGVGAAYASRALVPIRHSLAAQRQALRRQREFAADASHELRTPLTVIRASVDDLERHGSEPVATVGSALTDIRDEVDTLTSMVDDLLLLARSDSGAVELERVPVDLGDVASSGASALAPVATERGVTVAVDPEPAEILGDPTRLRQLVLILVDNAVRHSPSGGTVTVRVRGEAGEATLEVEDQGPGIRPEDLPRLFDRFYRAPGAPGGGTGLGLAIASWIVERHGGRIAAANRASGGARFTARIPLAR
jgi:signal transduction histidine kinase